MCEALRDILRDIHYKRGWAYSAILYPPTRLTNGDTGNKEEIQESKDGDH